MQQEVRLPLHYTANIIWNIEYGNYLLNSSAYSTISYHIHSYPSYQAAWIWKISHLSNYAPRDRLMINGFGLGRLRLNTVQNLATKRSGATNITSALFSWHLLSTRSPIFVYPHREKERDLCQRPNFGFCIWVIRTLVLRHGENLIKWSKCQWVSINQTGATRARKNKKQELEMHLLPISG